LFISKKKQNKKKIFFFVNETKRDNKVVQQNDINWSKRIRGKEAIAHNFFLRMQVLCVGAKNINLGFKQRSTLVKHCASPILTSLILTFCV
jgi:predicted membrane protein